MALSHVGSDSTIPGTALFMVLVVVALLLGGCLYKRARAHRAHGKAWLGSGGRRTADGLRMLQQSTPSNRIIDGEAFPSVAADEDFPSVARRSTASSSLSVCTSWVGGGGGSPKIDPSPEASPEGPEGGSRGRPVPVGGPSRRARRASASELGDELGAGRHAKPRTRMHSVAFGAGIAARSGPSAGGLAGMDAVAKDGKGVELADKQRAASKAGARARVASLFRPTQLPAEQAFEPVDDSPDSRTLAGGSFTAASKSMKVPTSSMKVKLRKEQSKQEVEGAAHVWKTSNQAPWWQSLFRGGSLLPQGQPSSSAADAAASPTTPSKGKSARELQKEREVRVAGRAAQGTAQAKPARSGHHEAESEKASSPSREAWAFPRVGESDNPSSSGKPHGGMSYTSL